MYQERSVLPCRKEASDLWIITEPQIQPYKWMYALDIEILVHHDVFSTENLILQPLHTPKMTDMFKKISRYFQNSLHLVISKTFEWIVVREYDNWFRENKSYQQMFNSDSWSVIRKFQVKQACFESLFQQTDRKKNNNSKGKGRTNWERYWSTSIINQCIILN